MRKILLKQNNDNFNGVGLFPKEYKIKLKQNAEPKIVPYHRIPVPIS